MSYLNPKHTDINFALKKIRLLKGYTREDVQKISSNRFTVQALGSYERNSRNITVKRLLELCDVYKISIELLLEFARTENPLHLIERSYNEQRVYGSSGTQRVS